MFELRPVSFDHPDARALTERAQDFYIRAVRGPDDDPVTAGEFSSPRGGFVVGYLDDQPVAMGGWAFTEHPQQAAIAFYHRHGYRSIAPFGYYGDSDQVVCLGKELAVADPVDSQPTS